jgi:protein ImuB
MMKRVMCVWLPSWPLQRILRAQPTEPASEKPVPLVLYAEFGPNKLWVVECSRNAAECGVVPGIPLAEAKGLLRTSPGSQSGRPQFIRHEPGDDQTALRELAGWCQRFSPVVAVEEPDSLLLDVTGCVHLFGGERRFSRRVMHDFRQRGFFVRATIADTIGAAWAMAHFEKQQTAVIPRGQQETALHSLPIEALRLPHAAVQTLHELGVRCIKQFGSLPRAGLTSRLGPEVVRRLDQALGRIPELLVPVRLPEPIEAIWEFEHPTGHRGTLEAVLRQLVERVVDRLAARQQGVGRFRVELISSEKQQTRLTLGLLRPSQSVGHLMELILTRLEQVSFVGEVVGLRLRVMAAALLESRQAHLFDAGSNPGSQRELDLLVDRMSNRLGKERVVRPRLSPDAQPEFAFRWEPLQGSNEYSATPETRNPVFLKKPGFSTRPAPARPLRLGPEPHPVEVTSVIPEGPPIRFFRDCRAYTVARCWGPERIETGWWRGRHIRRDYYRVETESGRRFWLFRRIGQGDWFLHGEFE